jgi:ribosome-associated protein
MAGKIDIERIRGEVEFITSRSSGAGGQNVNKVNSKVTLKWNVAASAVLSEDEKALVLAKLSSRLTTEGVLLLSSQASRSQLDNKHLTIEKLGQLLKKAFEKKKVRKATKPTKGSIDKKLKSKKQQSEKKKWRQKPGY